MYEVNRVCFWVCKYVMLTYTTHAFFIVWYYDIETGRFLTVWYDCVVVW